MKRYLLDSSAICAYMAPDEHSKDIHSLFEEYYSGNITFYVLDLTFYEVLNTLKSMHLSNRLTEKELEVFSAELFEYDFDVISPKLKKCLDISLVYSLSIYDSAYIEVAKSSGLELITLDKKLQTAYFNVVK